VGSVALKIVDKGELVCIAECVALEALGEGVQRTCEYHGAVANFVIPARQTKCMNFDGVLCKALFVGEVTVIGEVNVLKGADDEADVLGEDERDAREAGRLARGVCRVYDLLESVLRRVQSRESTYIVSHVAGAHDQHFHGLFLFREIRGLVVCIRHDTVCLVCAILNSGRGGRGCRWLAECISDGARIPDGDIPGKGELRV
jgi:hypothetical protein